MTCLAPTPHDRLAWRLQLGLVLVWLGVLGVMEVAS